MVDKITGELFHQMLSGTMMKEDLTPEELSLKTDSMMILMTMYECAVTKLKARIDVVCAEFEIKNRRNPVEYVKSRLKKPLHIMEKLRRKGFEYSLESIVYNLNDVAGIRLVCSFMEDIYKIADMLLADDTYRIVEKCDYIKNPKSNGYRSLHLVVEVPIVFSNNVQRMKVEVQIRTMAMDFWATLEHQIHYKKRFADDETLVKELKECADIIYSTDVQMQDIQKKFIRLSVPLG